MKKHPVMLRVIDAYVAKTTGRVESLLRAALDKISPEGGRDEALAFWRDNDRAPVAVRLHRLRAWASPSTDGADAELAALERGRTPSSPPQRPAPRSIGLRHAIDRTLSDARRELLDVSTAWSEILSDEAALRAAFAAHAKAAPSKEELDDEDMRTALAWCAERCAAVMSLLEARREASSSDGEERVSQRPAPVAPEDRERSDDDRERSEEHTSELQSLV